MRRIPERVTNFSIFSDGKGKAGIGEEITLPKIVAATEEFHGAGMAAPIDLLMGSLEKMDSAFTIKGIDNDTMKLLNIVEGADVPLTMRGAINGEAGAIKAMVVNMRGVLKEVDMGTVKIGESSSKFSMNVRYFKLTIDGEVIYDIDVVSNTVIINGVDQTAEMRRALGQ